MKRGGGAFEFRPVQAQAAHPRIDMQDGGQGIADLGRISPPAFDVAQAVERRDQAMFAKGVFGSGMRTVEDMDAGVRQVAAQRHAFGRVGDEEFAGPGIPQGTARRTDAQAVGIGLDHGPGNGAAAQGLGDGSVVGLKGRQVDGQSRAGKLRVDAGRVSGGLSHLGTAGGRGDPWTDCRSA